METILQPCLEDALDGQAQVHHLKYGRYLGEYKIGYVVRSRVVILHLARSRAGYLNRCIPYASYCDSLQLHPRGCPGRADRAAALHWLLRLLFHSNIAMAVSNVTPTGSKRCHTALRSHMPAHASCRQCSPHEVPWPLGHRSR